MRFVTLGQGAGFQVGHIGSLFVTVHTAAASAVMSRMLDVALEKHRSTYPRFPVLALVSGSGISTPESGLRDLVLAQEKRFEDAIIGAAVAIEARGLSAVLTRTFLVAYTLLSSHVFPVKSFASTELAVGWLQQLPNQETYFRTDTACIAELKQVLAQTQAGASASQSL